MARRQLLFQDDVRYASNHMWVRKSAAPDNNAGAIMTIGLDDLIQIVLGEIAFIDLPQVGSQVSAGDEIGLIEATKAVFNLHTPISGSISRVNCALQDSPELINKDPFGLGWIAEIAPDERLCDAEFSGLMSAEQARDMLHEIKK